MYNSTLNFLSNFKKAFTKKPFNKDFTIFTEYRSLIFNFVGDYKSLRE